MKARIPIRAKPIRLRMIAPCGMDCALCIGHLREKRRCPGCNDRRDADKPPHCVSCGIKTCEAPGRPRKFCLACSRFPCLRLRRLDQRYRTKYGMSMIENLEFIRASGIRKFVAREKTRWACPKCGETLCVHRTECLRCGHPRKMAGSSTGIKRFGTTRKTGPLIETRIQTAFRTSEKRLGRWNR